jgi:hypothetical protein
LLSLLQSLSASRKGIPELTSNRERRENTIAIKTRCLGSQGSTVTTKQQAGIRAPAHSGLGWNKFLSQKGF